MSKRRRTPNVDPAPTVAAGPPRTAAPADPAAIAALATRQRTCLGVAASELAEAAVDSLWNAPRLLLAYAGSSRLGQSTLDDRRRLEDRVWLVGSVPLSSLAGPVPFARGSQLIGYVDDARRHAAVRADTAAGVVASHGVSAGARLNVGSARLNAFAELLGEWRSEVAPGAKRTVATRSLGVEFLAASGIWISTGVGRRYADRVRAERTVLLANIRWGISSKAYLGNGAS